MKFVAIAFIAGLGLASLGAAQAMPAAPLPLDGIATPVADGCGRGMIRGRSGKCRVKPLCRAGARYPSVPGRCRVMPRPPA